MTAVDRACPACDEPANRSCELGPPRCPYCCGRTLDPPISPCDSCSELLVEAARDHDLDLRIDAHREERHA